MSLHYVLLRVCSFSFSYPHLINIAWQFISYNSLYHQETANIFFLFYYDVFPDPTLLIRIPYFF